MRSNYSAYGEGAVAGPSLIRVEHLAVGSGGIGIQQNLYGKPRPEEPVLSWPPLPDRLDAFALLDWRIQLTPLIGVKPEEEALLEWATKSSGTRIRFLTGPGGSGKTRLAAELAQELHERGWRAGFVSLTGNPLDFDVTDSKVGRLLIIDYPEDKRARIRGFFEQLTALQPPRFPLKILMLSRQAIDRWRSVIDDFSAGTLCDEQALREPVFSSRRGVEHCRAIWKALKERNVLTKTLPPIADAQIERWIEKAPAIHGLPLFVAAAALHAAEAGEQAFALGGGDIIRALVRKECARLNRTQTDVKIFETDALARLVALSSVGGGLTPETLRSLADPTLEIGLPPPHKVMAALRGTSWWRDGELASARPDILAATLVREVLGQVGEDALVSEWLWRVLQFAISNQSVEEVVARLDRHDHDIRTIFGWSDTRFSFWLERAVTDLEGTVLPERCEKMRSLAYMRCGLGCSPLSIVVMQSLLREAPPAVRPGLLTNLGVQLNSLGRREDALAATIEAVSHYRVLAEARPEAFLPDLAVSLNNLGNRLNALGQWQEALAAAEEAVSIRRTLAGARPEAFLPNLAASLNNLGSRLHELGRDEEALAAVQEAVSIRRTLAEARPEAFQPDLAASLNNVANQLVALRRWEEALPAAEDAVRIRRRLAEARPQAFQPDLAASIATLVDCLRSLERRKEALPLAEEAIGYYSALAEARPNVFLYDFMVGVVELSLELARSGRRLTESPVAEKAFALFVTLQNANPEALRRSEAGENYQDELIDLEELPLDSELFAPRGTQH